MGSICESTKNNISILVKKEHELEIIYPKEIINREIKYLENENEIIINNQIFINKVKGTPLEKYEILKSLGEGSFGKVFLIKNKEIKVQRAMKEIKKDANTDEKDIQNEINILKSIDHPHIIKIFEFYSFNEKYFLITEYCKEGELFNQIDALKPFAEAHLATIVYQILLALIYCHSNNIIHRDLKPENIMIEGRDKNGYFIIKVIDFGTATIFDKNKKETQFIGSPYYIAPEVISLNYGEKCDLWSLGVILYILLSGAPPFKAKNETELFNLIQHAPLDFSDKFEKVSFEVKDYQKTT